MKTLLCVILTIALCMAIPMVALASAPQSLSKTLTTVGFIGTNESLLSVAVSPVGHIDWEANEDNDWTIDSGPCFLINNSELVDLAVVLVAFDHENEHAEIFAEGGALAGRLELKLAGALALPNDPNLAEAPWDDGEDFGGRLLKHGQNWRFKLVGKYTGEPPTEDMNPEYNIALQFHIPD